MRTAIGSVDSHRSFLADRLVDALGDALEDRLNPTLTARLNYIGGLPSTVAGDTDPDV
jgi:hypothetical protein